MTGPEELLSAYLDDELDPAERAQVEAYLSRSADGRARLDGLAEIRSALQALPALDPPRPLVAPDVSTAGRTRRVVPLLVAAAVVLLGGLLFFGRDGSDPAPAMDTGQLLALHQDAQRMMVGDSGDTPGDLVVVSDTSEIAHMPDDLGDGMDRMGIYGTDGLVQLVYSDGDHVVSVFEQSREAAAPMEGEPMTVVGRDAVHKTMEGSDVVMVAEGDMVLTVVGDGEPESLGAMAGLVISA